MELQIKDLETLDNFKQKNIKISQSGDKIALKNIQIVDRFINHIESGKPARTLEINDEEQLLIIYL